MPAVVPHLQYRCPGDLAITPLTLRRAIVIGQCLAAGWPDVLKELAPGCECDFLLLNNASQVPPEPPHPPDEYDFQIVQLPIRTILPEYSYFRLSYADKPAYERLFDDARDRLRLVLDGAMRWNRDHGILSFVTNFIVPQQNPLGRLLPRYDLRNFVYLVEKLNECLAEQVSQYNNAYLFDLDQVIATYGRKYFQDDAVWPNNHGAALTDADFAADGERLEATVKASDLYPLETQLYIRLAVAELLAMYRSIRQIDAVKLLVVDIDDTLWRGVAAERGGDVANMVEGWPLGLAEALLYLKRRGVILAIVSKNEESLIAPIWQRVFSGRLLLDDFAVRKISWQPKPVSFEEVLRETNLLPRNAVYIDDNPVERAAIKSAFPDVRTLGPTPLVWRRILLWSAEMQVPVITAESAARSDMVRTRIERDSQRKQLSPGEFLRLLKLAVGFQEIPRIEHPAFPRVFELLNKTNQFNTTGRRWTQQECMRLFADGGRIFAFSAKERFTEHGLIGVIVVEGAAILQFVMSCRVVGLEVEIAAVAALLPLLRERTDAPVVTADLRETEFNLLARDLWSRCGFQPDGKRWARPHDPVLAVPGHVTLAAMAPGPEDAPVPAAAD